MENDVGKIIQLKLPYNLNKMLSYSVGEFITNLQSLYNITTCFTSTITYERSKTLLKALTN